MLTGGDVQSVQQARRSTDRIAPGEGFEHLYRTGETFFSDYGPAMVANGWSVFPQERDDRRRPGKVGGVSLKWRPYQDRLPTVEEAATWALECPAHNVAVIAGPSSRNVFAMDLDIADETLSWQVRDLADEFLGETPFKRVGRAPRVVLLYRMEEGVRIHRRAFKFVGEDPSGSVKQGDDAIEILASGSAFTAYGNHHKTGRYFMWVGDRQPFYDGPEHAPLVTPERVSDFLKAVQEKRAFFRNAPGLAVNANWVFDPASGMQAPRLSGGAILWTENEDGLVTDGREAFLWELVRQSVYANPDAAHAGDEGEARIMALVAEHFRRQAVSGGKWSDDYLRSEVMEKVRREALRFRESGSAGLRVRKDEATGETVAEPGQSTSSIMPPERATVAGPDSISFIKPVDPLSPTMDRRRLRIDYDPSKVPGRDVAEARALVPDRASISAKVQSDIATALGAYFDEVYGAFDGPTRIHVLKAPTGAGKTTQTIRRIGEDPRTKSWDAALARGEEGPGPILFLLPTYNNIDELRLRADVLNLDGSLDDDDLETQARERGLIREDEMDARVGDLRRDALSAELRTMVYKGKLAAGCRMVEKMRMLNEAGVGTSGLCKSVRKDDEGRPETVLCEHYVGCPAIEQRKNIAESHVVFLPHAFLTLSIPEELKAVRAVIADERIFHLFVHTTSFSRTTLKLPRKRPQMTAKERRDIVEKVEGALEPDDLLTDRDTAADRAAAALQRAACPARVLWETMHVYPNGKEVSGLDLVRHAKRVCGNALTSGTAVTPTTSLEDLRAMCQMPTGTEIREEWRFWQIVEERVEALRADALHAGLIAKARENHAERAREAARLGEPIPEDRTRFYETAWRRKATGDGDLRLQFLLEEQDDESHLEKVRLSWRSRPNWPDAPLLLLDASASPEIIGKIFDQREVVVHDVEAPLNVRTVAVVDRTYSNSSIVSGANRTTLERIVAGRTKNSLRRAISTISAMYGWGRVVCGASVVVRKAINEAWKQPGNVDWCHFGAMRGLDFAKHHAAAVSVGRMEVPIKIIDGLVAALTYDDPVPELPFDLGGQNKGPDGKPLMLPSEPQTIRLRSGHDVTVPVPRFPGAWARKVQEQYREEELSQFLGRLRPVYREGEAPVWFAISKVIPAHVVVDEIVTMEDILSKPDKGRFIVVTLWDAVRLADGVVHPALMASVSPTSFKSEAKAAAEMRSHGFDPVGGRCGMDRRGTWGFTPVKVRSQGTDGWTYAFVRSDVAEPGMRVRDSFARYLGMPLGSEDVQVGTPTRPPVGGMQRTPDWVDLQVGTMEDRSDAEHRTMAASAVWALDNLPLDAFLLPTGTTKHLPITLTAEAGEFSGKTFGLGDIAAAKSTDEMWSKVKAGHLTALDAKVAQPGANYEHLADGSHDAVGQDE